MEVFDRFDEWWMEWTRVQVHENEENFFIVLVPLAEVIRQDCRVHLLQLFEAGNGWKWLWHGIEWLRIAGSDGRGRSLRAPLLDSLTVFGAPLASSWVNFFLPPFTLFPRSTYRCIEILSIHIFNDSFDSSFMLLHNFFNLIKNQELSVDEEESVNILIYLKMNQVQYLTSSLTNRNIFMTSV